MSFWRTIAIAAVLAFMVLQGIENHLNHSQIKDLQRRIGTLETKR